MKFDAKKILQDAKESVKIEVDLDGFVLKQVDSLVIPTADILLEKLKKAIPGQLDDALIDSIKPKLYAEVKEELQKLLIKAEDKINEVVKP